MAKQPYSLRARTNPRTQLLNEISRIKVTIKMKEMRQEDPSSIDTLKKMLLEKEQQLHQLDKA